MNTQNQIKDTRVAAVKIASASYSESEIAAAIRRNADVLGWSDDGRGAFGAIIEEGAKVVVKPNLVLHKNQGKDGLAPLVTHQSIIKAVVAEVLKVGTAAEAARRLGISQHHLTYFMDKWGLRKSAGKRCTPSGKVKSS